MFFLLDKEGWASTIKISLEQKILNVYILSSLVVHIRVFFYISKNIGRHPKGLLSTLMHMELVEVSLSSVYSFHGKSRKNWLWRIGRPTRVI